MNQDIIAMAREAGAWAQQSKNRDVEYVMSGQSLERFAELVRADERNSWPAEMEAMKRQVNILTDALAEQPAKPQQEPVAWKLMPRKATDEMLKAMDECSTEGYDERLYAGHASSVYMAAWDSLPEVKHELNCVCGAIWEGDELVCTPHPPAQRKPLTDEEIVKITADPCLYIRGGDYRIDIARAIEAAHGITGEQK